MTLIKDEEAERLINSLNLKNPRQKILNTHEAINFISSEDVIAPGDLPGRDIAAQDGYAINMVDGCKNYTIKEGADELKPCEAVYVGTGWPVPLGTNSVVRMESAKVNGRTLTPVIDPRPGGDIERAGEDIRNGTRILRKGEIITPYHVSLLLAMNITKLKVFDLCAGIVSVGDEIVPYDSAKVGVRDSITPLIKEILPFARFREAHAPDSRPKIASAIRRLSESCDFIITIGGSSVGKKDLTKKAIADIGEMVFEGVQTNVVKRGGVGLVNGVPVLALPGRIVSAVTVFHVHGLHILSRMVGRELRRFGEGTLAEGITVKHSMNSTYLFKVQGKSLIPLKWGTGLYGQLINADAFARLERNREYKKGDKINFQYLIKNNCFI